MRRSLDDCIDDAVGRLCELMSRDGMDADRLQAFELALGKLVGGERRENAAGLVSAVRRSGGYRVAQGLRLGKTTVYRKRTAALAKLSR